MIQFDEIMIKPINEINSDLYPLITPYGAGGAGCATGFGCNTSGFFCKPLGIFCKG